MMKLYKNNIRLAKKIARGTTIAGIVFLLSYYFTYDFSLVIGGAFFGLGTFLIVLTTLVSDLITAKRQNFSSKETSRTILWNSFTLFFIFIFTIFGLKLTNSAKIVIKNNSSEPIKNVLISGCQTFDLNEIPSKDSKTIHVFYNNNEDENCAIEINYTTIDALKHDILLMETKSFRGEKVVYTID